MRRSQAVVLAAARLAVGTRGHRGLGLVCAAIVMITLPPSRNFTPAPARIGHLAEMPDHSTNGAARSRAVAPSAQ